MLIPKVITHIETTKPVAALTFDDGPHPESTPRVLSILEQFNARATFFMVGHKAEQYPDLVNQVAESGHAIGNHAWHHINLTKIKSRLRRIKQMMACSRATAPHHQPIFRPPYGSHNRQMLIDAMLLRYRVILWNASAQDWQPQAPEEIARKITERIGPGTIFLLHDAIISESKSNIQVNRDAMIEGLQLALHEMPSTTFVTVPELLTYGRPACRWPHHQGR